MVKTKKGRQTNNSNGKKRDTPPRVRQVREKRKEKEQNLNEIDTTTLADDDPTPSLRSRVQGFLALMGDNSSDEETTSDEEQKQSESETPRRGSDKKRQRFAEVNEVIEIEKDDSTTSGLQEPPNLVRLPEDDMDSESAKSQEITIADILGEGPEGTVRLQQPHVITKDCRYTLQIKIEACENPFQNITEKFQAFFTWMKGKFGKDLAIATWDDSDGKEKIYYRPSQLPKATETSLWTAIWGNWMTVKPGQEGTAFLKLRLVTKTPDALIKRLNEIGECKDEINAATGFQIGRSPIPCQAVQVGCVGWLFGSNKYMNSVDLLQEITRLINLPRHVRIGISWRTIKLSNGRTPPWIENTQPASALHIDMDWLYGPVYKPALSNLFKKHGTIKPLGMNLRLVPCFSSDEGKNATTDMRTAAMEMAEKQEFLIKEHITIIKTPYILNLDKPTKPNGTMTLRRYLKNLHPHGLVAARLILSVDKAWQEGSKETNVVTTK